MKKFLGIVVLGLLWCNISLTDEKPGRFFEDQPDVNDDYQIHLIYFLAKNTKDKERDVNGYIEKKMKMTNNSFFKMTRKKQKI